MSYFPLFFFVQISFFLYFVWNKYFFMVHYIKSVNIYIGK